MSDQPIKITAEVLQHDRSSCKFTVDSVLSKEGIIRFKDLQAAKDSPLAERLFGIEGVTTACEYLADVGLIDKASTDVLLTPRSHVTLQELAFFSTEPPDAT